MIVCYQIKQKQAQDRKTHFETMLLPVAKVLSPVSRQVPTKFKTNMSFALIFIYQEDVNGEKLTVKKWWIFGADFFTVWCLFFHGLRRYFTVCKGHKR